MKNIRNMLKVFWYLVKHRIIWVPCREDVGIARDTGVIFTQWKIWTPVVYSTAAHELGHLIHPMGWLSSGHHRDLVNEQIVVESVLWDEFTAWQWAVERFDVNHEELARCVHSYVRYAAFADYQSISRKYPDVTRIYETSEYFQEYLMSNLFDRAFDTCNFLKFAVDNAVFGIIDNPEQGS